MAVKTLKVWLQMTFVLVWLQMTFGVIFSRSWDLWEYVTGAWDILLYFD
jgi:hypothetical protein